MIALLLASCTTPGEPVDREAPVLVPGPPVAGMAEIAIDFPMGAPMGGYTGRCRCFGGGTNEIDDRASDYVTSFLPSAGIQTRPRAVALWLENGDQDLALIKADLIYSFDGLVEELEARLGTATGRDMRGRVAVATSHTHHAPANWNHGITWYLGGDRYDDEVFERLVGSLETAALQAWGTREPAALGMGVAKDWDPDGYVYRDRRGENDTLAFFDDIPAGSYKDPYLSVLRVDTAAGDPLGLFFAFGMHGTVLDLDNAMWSTDAPGGVEIVVQDQFDTPVVVGHLQTGGGDASPAGSDSMEYARLETIGEYAVDAIIDLWEATPVSTDPIRLETVTHAIDQSRDRIRVTRGGTTDLHYAPYDPSEDFVPDEVVYEADGSIASPIDEFNTEYGGAFCGADLPLIPGVSVGSSTYPYSSCIDVGTIASVIAAFFEMSQDDLVLPLPESLRANATASRFGPLSFRDPDGSTSSDDLLLAFFPGEPTAMYTEQFRRRAAAEVGMPHSLPVGYAQDHEGYLLIPEDWLLGGYEPNINIWGPLQGEYLMEEVLVMAEKWLATDVVEPHDLLGQYVPTSYPEEPAARETPDTTSDAGTALTEAPDYLWLPIEGLGDPTAAEPVVERISGVAQFMWRGGDPAVDLPRVVLERLEGDAWVEVTTRAGRPITEALPDILLVHTPDPLFPSDAAQTHTWWAAWQAVGHVHDRPGVPAGTYRLHVTGKTFAGGGEGWPWPANDYDVAGEPFEVVPAAITVEVSAETVTAWLPAPSWGWRLVDLEGDSRGANPVRDAVFTWEFEDGTEVDEELEGTVAGGVTTWAVAPPAGAFSLTVTDAWGNQGQASL